MLRKTTYLACLLALTCATLPAAAAPASTGATAPEPLGGLPGVSVDLSSVILGFNVTAVGAGETTAEAEANALAELRKRYFVLRYSVEFSFCDDIVDPFTGQSLGTFCAVQIRARVIPRAFVLDRPFVSGS